MTYTVIIPARLESSRLSHKVLRKIAGKTMLQHVYERAVRSHASRVIIAVDSDAVARCATAFGATVCFTDIHHSSGTARISEAVNQLGLSDDEIVINVQADEPLIPPEVIDQLARDLLMYPLLPMSTVYEPIHDQQQLTNPGCVKLVLDREGCVLYFSRQMIPWHPILTPSEPMIDLSHYCRHVGVYAYRVSMIKRYATWAPSPLERWENLEQLRVLWYGEKIHAVRAVKDVGIEVNTEEDLIEVTKILSAAQG